MADKNKLHELVASIIADDTTQAETSLSQFVTQFTSELVNGSEEVVAEAKKVKCTCMKEPCVCKNKKSEDEESCSKM